MPCAVHVRTRKKERKQERERKNVKTYVAFLVRALEAQGRTLGLDVADASARVALFGGDGARLGARRRLVAWFATVVAEPLLRRTLLGDVADCRVFSIRQMDEVAERSMTHDFHI